MTTLQLTPGTLMSTPAETLQTSTAADDETLASRSLELSRNREQWQGIIDKFLVEWGRNSKALADDDLIPPSLLAIRVASTIARWGRDNQVVAPMRVVLDGDGGVAFELESDHVFEAIEVQENGTVEVLTCMSGKVCGRQIVSVSF